MTVRKEEPVISKTDSYFVKEDPARIYRDLKDLLVEELGIDRIEAGRNEFSVSAPKDKLRIRAFKEKSPHTVLYFKLSWKAKDPRSIYKMQREEEVLKAEVSTSAKVITVYPGREPLTWLPEAIAEHPKQTIDLTGLEAEETTSFQESKFYEVLVNIWYNKFYSKEIAKYEEEAEEMLIHMHNLMREKFGVEEAIARSGASQYKPTWK